MATQKTPRQNVYINDTFYPDGVTLYKGDQGQSGDPNALLKTDVGGDDKFYALSGDRESGSVLLQALGETDELRDSSRGGQDAFYGGSYAGFQAYGQYWGGAGWFDPASGFLENEGQTLSTGSGNVFSGDALIIRNSSRGGNDLGQGGLNAQNFFWGDARDAAHDKANGGADTLYGGDAFAEQNPNPYYDPEAQYDIESWAIDSDPDRDGSGDVAALNYLVGDADHFGGGFDDSSTSVIGGGDKLYGGDARARSYSAEVWNFIGGDAAAYELDSNTFRGGIYGHGNGGADLIEGGDAKGGIFYYQDDDDEDGADYDEYYEGDASALNFLMGDSVFMTDWATGGADNLIGGSAFSGERAVLTNGFGFNTEGSLGPDGSGDFGESGTLEANVYNLMSGDAFYLDDNTQAGSDSLKGGNVTGLTTIYDASRNQTRAINVMAGDGYVMGLYTDGPVKFGNDRLTGGNLTYDTVSNNGQKADVRNWIWGDLGIVVESDGTFGDIGSFVDSAFNNSESSQGVMEGNGNSGTGGVNGGADTLTGGVGRDVFNYLVGDADVLRGSATGGWDTLIGGDFIETDNVLIGDARELVDSRGGKDQLISGAGVDLMWGDAQIPSGSSIGQADIFTFRTNCNDDAIFDFRRSDGDKIDLSAFNTGRKNMTDFKNFDTFILSARATDVASYAYTDNNGTSYNGGAGILIDLDVSANSNGSVYIQGLSVSQLTSDMFLF